MLVPCVRWWLGALVSLAVLASPACAERDPSLDIAARAMLVEAEDIIEYELPHEMKEQALQLLDEIEQKYPGSHVLPWVRLRRAQCLMFLDRFDEAITTGRAIVLDHPGTALAGWAQTVVGESLVKKGESIQGAAELLKVPSILPDRSDTGPLDIAYGVIGRVLTEGPNDTENPLIAATRQGLEVRDAETKAVLLSAVAVYRAQQDRLDLANAVAQQLAWECPEQTDDLNWAVSRIARITIDKGGMHRSWAAETLASLAHRTSEGEEVADQEIARAHLSLARYYMKSGNLPEAAAVLENARDKCLGTLCGDIILYDLGNVLYRQGRDLEAIGTLQKFVKEVPLSGYVAPALYSIGIHSGSTHPQVAADALKMLADGEYGGSWRGLALWRLGSLLRMSDPTGAMDCYMQAIHAFKESSATEIRSAIPEWKTMQQVRIEQIEFDMRSLEKAVEVTK